jgi:hypothetical protein
MGPVTVEPHADVADRRFADVLPRHQAAWSCRAGSGTTSSETGPTSPESSSWSVLCHPSRPTVQAAPLNGDGHAPSGLLVHAH